MTKLEVSNIISKHLGIKLLIKRDDLYPLPGGGNKARKLDCILNQKVKKKYNAIVTTGSSHSNHIRATAIYAAMLGWKTICIIHDQRPREYEGNLKITGMTGAELRFVEKDEVKVSMDNAMEELKENGYNPLYIWGGGHCLEGSYAYFKAVKELKEQLGNVIPSYLFTASGTGATQAGIEIGIKRFLPGCQVVGISVARERERGVNAILESMTELNTFLSCPVQISQNINFDDKYIGHGYASAYPEMLETIRWAAKSEGVILDPIYTGKAFHAMREYVYKGLVPQNSVVIFWHTGGLLNMLASKEISLP
jgi:1-aminocyclopropane-1-carboxylate deaminase/D-cysteine desulfhydrase-like pyridoxal-dependent ACC family enzyme